MINSLFGMVIVPYEKYRNQIDESKYSEDKNYIEIRNMINDLERNKFLRSTYRADSETVGVFSFIGHLRNAFAHSGNGRLNFYPVNSKKDNIKAVYFMDKYENKDERTYYFCCKLSVKRIERLCELIPSLYKTIEKSISESERSYIYSQYRKQLGQLDAFLGGKSNEEIGYD